jgi:hypothetical protein
MLVVKKWSRLYDNVFLYIDGGHLLKVNWLTHSLIEIDQKVCKAIQLLKSCQPIILKTH